MAVASFAVVSIIFGSGTVVSVLYLDSGSRIVTPGVLGHDLTLASSIWITGIWCIVSVDLSHSVLVVVTDVGMLGLVYHVIRSGNVAPGVSGWVLRWPR